MTNRELYMLVRKERTDLIDVLIIVGLIGIALLMLYVDITQ